MQMRVGVLSDTHLRDGALLPASVLEGMAGVEVILHAGDIVSLSVIDVLEAIAPVYAVRGNMDPSVVANTLPDRRIVSAAGKEIGLVHGWGAPAGLESRVRQRFATDGVHAIVYGHTHLPEIEQVGSLLLFNPGSATGRFPAPYASVGILHVGEDMRGEIVRL